MEVIGVVSAVISATFLTLYRPLELVHLYGMSGLIYYVFGNRTIWRMEMQVLAAFKDEDAFDFQKSVQEECAMISVAAAIVAQIAITGLAFSELSKTHWVSRALFLFSLISSLMAVYYAATQHRVMGRLRQPWQIRRWIRGRFHQPEKDQARSEIDPEVNPQLSQTTRLESESSARELATKSLCPSITAVLTISAPYTLLSSSLISLLLAIGVYFGFVWTKALETDAKPADGRNVMIVYLVSVTVCFGVYSISHFLKDSDNRPEIVILREHVAKFLVRNSHPTDQLRHDLELAYQASSNEDPIASLMRPRPN